MIARTIAVGEAVTVQEDPIVEKMLPTGWCDLCNIRTHAQTEYAVRKAYLQHRRRTGHDAWGQRKFRPSNLGRVTDGPPTFRCKLADCPFTTSAKNSNMVRKALRRHHSSTGHEVLVRIPGSLVKVTAEEEEFDVNVLRPPGPRRQKPVYRYPVTDIREQYEKELVPD